MFKLLQNSYFCLALISLVKLHFESFLFTLFKVVPLSPEQNV